ncbi:MAG TPA: response regulator [Hyphomicrobiaceae bacterium]|nr:response regulator [Hyphomicrobiaceae bacterium]
MKAAQDTKDILVVDDEEPVRTLLRECFEMEGWRVSEAPDAQAAVERLDQGPVHLITLDLKLGGDDGLELARQIRGRCNVPIIMISGKGDTIDRVVGLELGADDYIAKPFHVREVLARVRAVLRRYEAAPVPVGVEKADDGERYVFPGWSLDINRRELVSELGIPQDLTTAEFNMLAMFVRRPHRVLSRDNIMDLLKGNEWSPFDRSIDALVVRLRRKIEVNPESPRLIKTVRGVGYVFAADVRRT